MKAEWWKKWRRLWGDELFGKTRSRLTLLYGGVLILFLAVFVVIVYGLLRFWILSDQGRELRALADREQQILQKHVRLARGLDRVRDNAEIMASSEDQLFTYILNGKGQTVLQVEAGRWDRDELLDRMKEWTDKPDTVHEVSLAYSPGGANERRGPRGYRYPLQSGDTERIRLLVTGRAILQGDTQIGTVFVGKNVSYQYELLDWMLLVLSGLAFVFFLAALGISHLLSKRIMVPLKVSYEQQRQFAADASHELRTPLSVMQSSIEALELELEPGEDGKDPFLGRLLANLKDEIKRMTRLTADLLTLARSDSPELQVARERFDLVPPVRQTVDSMASVAEAKGLVLEAELPETLTIPGDPDRIKQLLYILLDNAVKYTPPGGEIRVSLTRTDRHAVLAVRDTGIGIAAEELPRVFDRFYRADKSRSRQTGGYGLGLSIARWIAESHRGTIRASSSPGEGSVFTVQLPVS